MTGATAGAASTLAGSETSERRSKCSAMSGAVPSVAAIVTASASARPRGTPAAPSRARSAGTSASSESTAAKLSCQPGSAAACGFQASVSAAASSSAYQRDAGRPASAATSPAAPITAARWIDGPAPASGTYAATSASASHSRALSPSPAAAPSASTSVASRMTFAPLAATRCARPVVRKSSRTSSVSAPSWPSTMPRASAPCGAGTPPVSARSVRARTPSSTPSSPPRRAPRRADRLGPQDRVRAAPALVLVVRAERDEAARDRDHGAGHRRRGGPAHARRRLDEHPLAAQARRRDARAERAHARVLEQRRARGDLAGNDERAAIERGEPRVGDDGAGEQRRDHAER